MIEKIEQELNHLVSVGTLLFYAMANEIGSLPEEVTKSLAKKKLELPKFREKYENWYTESLRVVHQIIPDREDDFIQQYQRKNRKDVDFLTYGIFDYLIGLRTTRGGEILVDGEAALPKMQVQLHILESAQGRFRSSLFDITEVLQADMFDTELEAATELCKKGFLRGSGAISGVVLEKHLGHVCLQHKIQFRKKHITIADYNQALKDNEVIDTPQWRFIQHLTDLRNLCDHKKNREPTKQDVSDLAEGASKIIKTVH